MRDRRYLVVFGACLTQFMVIGLLFSFGLLFKPFEAEFGWSRTLMSAASSLATVMMGMLAIVGGRLNDRFGPRIVLAVSGLAYGLGWVLMSRIAAPWHLFALTGTLIGMGLATHDVVTLSTVARWFERRRGIMSGVVKVGTALGQVAMPPIAAALILRFDWRGAVVALGIAAAVLLLVAALSMRHPPARKDGGQGATIPGLAYAEARRTRIFWTLCATQFLFFTALMTVPLHLAVHGIDLGMSPAKAAVLLSVIGAASIIGRLAVGGLSDRIGSRNAYLLCFLFLIASLAGLLTVTSHAPLFVVVAAYGFGHGGLFTVVSPAVAGYFGLRAHGAIFGTVLFFGTLGGAIGPILAGFAFDRTGSYQPAFAGLLALAVIGLALVLSLPTAAALRAKTAT